MGIKVAAEIVQSTSRVGGASGGAVAVVPM